MKTLHRCHPTEFLGHLRTAWIYISAARMCTAPPVLLHTCCAYQWTSILLLDYSCFRWANLVCYPELLSWTLCQSSVGRCTDRTVPALSFRARLPSSSCLAGRAVRFCRGHFLRHVMDHFHKWSPMWDLFEVCKYTARTTCSPWPFSFLTASVGRPLDEHGNPSGFRWTCLTAHLSICWTGRYLVDTEFHLLLLKTLGYHFPLNWRMSSPIELWHLCRVYQQHLRLGAQSHQYYRFPFTQQSS